MSLNERLHGDLKRAMRSRDAPRRSTIRFLMSEIHNVEISTKRTLEENEIVGILAQQAQQRRDSIEIFGQAGRRDLVSKEQAELDIILEYLPHQLDREEIAEIVRKVICDVKAAGPADINKIMGAVMPLLKGKANGRDVSAVTSKLLEELE